MSISVFELEKVALELIVMGSEYLKEQSKERLSSLSSDEAVASGWGWGCI